MHNVHTFSNAQNIDTVNTPLYRNSSYKASILRAMCLGTWNQSKDHMYALNFNNLRLNCSSGSQYEMWAHEIKWNNAFHLDKCEWWYLLSLDISSQGILYANVFGFNNSMLIVTYICKANVSAITKTVHTVQHVLSVHMHKICLH